MKKLLTSAALALTLTAAGMTSYAVNWVYLGQDGNDRIYYDTSSVSRQGNLVAVTMQEREADGEAEEYNYLFDTHRKKYTLASKIEYDRNGNVKKIETFHESDFGWKKVKENSEEELLYKQIVNKPAPPHCNRQGTRNRQQEGIYPYLHNTKRKTYAVND